MPDNGTDRLDRIERLLEQSVAAADVRMTRLEQRQADTTGLVGRLADVTQTLVGTVRELGERLDRYIEEHRREHEAHQRVHDEVEERFTALMRIMDEWIRRNPPEAQQ